MYSLKWCTLNAIYFISYTLFHCDINIFRKLQYEILFLCTQNYSKLFTALHQ